MSNQIKVWIFGRAAYFQTCVWKEHDPLYSILSMKVLQDFIVNLPFFQRVHTFKSSLIWWNFTSWRTWCNSYLISKILRVRLQLTLHSQLPFAYDPIFEIVAIGKLENLYNFGNINFREVTPNHLSFQK
jgi:hypothetical protein